MSPVCAVLLQQPDEHADGQVDRVPNRRRGSRGEEAQEARCAMIAV